MCRNLKFKIETIGKVSVKYYIVKLPNLGRCEVVPDLTFPASLYHVVSALAFAMGLYIQF